MLLCLWPSLFLPQLLHLNRMPNLAANELMKFVEAPSIPNLQVRQKSTSVAAPPAPPPHQEEIRAQGIMAAVRQVGAASVDAVSRGGHCAAHSRLSGCNGNRSAGVE